MYYGTAHQSFLLLAKFSRKSRDMLNQNYEAIINLLLQQAIFISVTNENKVALRLPSLLFNFTIKIKSEEVAVAFVQLIENIREMKGYYFWNHYLHERLIISNIFVDIYFVNIIYPYCDDLLSIKVFENKWLKQKLVFNDSLKLIDKITLSDKNFFKLNNKEIIFPHYINKKKKQLKPSFVLFKRIFSLFLNKLKYDEVINALEDIRDLELQIDHIYFSCSSLEEFESFTNPEYFIKKPKSI